MSNNIVIFTNCTDQEFLNTVRINGLQKYNIEKTNGKLKKPDMEIGG
ncbi:hypothetical protein [Mesobacillus zeae]|nr:hypothetical protein [Mesobacillus zeae]